MKIVFLLVSFGTLVYSGLITHHYNGEEDDHQSATSYQHFHMEHFHAVPTYIKKEDKHLLDHPISIGKSSSNIEVHHGNKHDLGYAVVDGNSDLHPSINHSSYDQGGLTIGMEEQVQSQNLASHEDLVQHPGVYEVHDQTNNENSRDQGDDYAHYALSLDGNGYHLDGGESGQSPEGHRGY